MIKILGDNVALIPIRDPDKIGSLYIPESAKSRVDQGVVKYIGPNVKSVRIGDYVTFSGYSGTLLDIADPEHPDHPSETLIILGEDFIYAVLDDLPSTDVPGLYFLDRDNTPFTATIEMALELISRALSEADWRQYQPGTGNGDAKGINVVPEKASIEDYNKMRGG